MAPLVQIAYVLLMAVVDLAAGQARKSGAVYQEEALRTSLLTGYVKEARPVLNHNDAVNVSVNVVFVRIEDLIETTDTFAATLFIVHMWEDPRLKWNMSAYGGIKEVRLAKEKLWTPDLVLFNVAVQGTPQTRYEDVVTVIFDGHLIWVPMITLYATCPMDLTRFPYDVQQCTLVFGSWTRPAAQLTFKFISTNKTEIDVDLSVNTTHFPLDDHPQWDLVGKAKAKITTKSYPCCVDSFSLLTVTCMLARKPQFYRYVIVGPATVIGILVPAIFLLPARSKEKSTYGLLLLLCLTVMMLILDNAIPFSHASLPHIASFYLGTMILTCFSIISSVLVVNLSIRGSRRKPLPAWIRTVFLGRLGIRRMLCMGDYLPVDNVYSVALRSDDTPLNDPSLDGDVTSFSPLSSTSVTSPPLHCEPPALGESAQLREIHRCVRFMMGKLAADDSYSNVNQEWEELARVMDRCLFITFLILYVFTSVTLLM